MDYPVMEAQQKAWAQGGYVNTADAAVPTHDPGRGGGFEYPSIGPVEKAAPVAEPSKAQGFEYPSLGKNAPESTETAGQGKGGTSDTPKADPKPEATPARSETIPPDAWTAELDKGNYDGVGASVLSELRSLGASDAEYSSAQSLVNLASEKRADPAWREWALQMTDWVRGLRGSKP
jgi:hypothetical protein